MTTSATRSMYPQDVAFAALEEIRDSAARTLPRDVLDFLEGGAGRETTLRANLAAFERRVIRPRPMSGVSTPDTTTTFLGVPLAVPLLTAPFGGDALFHPDGHLAVARANELCGTASIVPEAGTYSYEQLAKTAPAAARFAQLHPFDHFEQGAERVRAAGYTALCVTVDCPTAGFRVRNRVNRFNPDLTFFGGNLLDVGTPDVAEMFERLFRHDAPTWDWARLAEATRRCGMPWIAKGVLTAEAAGRAVEAGASAVVVSNHGGRQLDPAPASLDALPEVVRAVAGRVPVALDSGVRSGSDVFLALALGADVVVIGRLAAYGLAAGGEEGVRRTIELLTEELRTLMVLAGVADLRGFDPSLVAVR
ncbi:alpha-hydroxy-acid oxidizing protein [Amycolatopsis acidiphila]|uniref:Alpha-hydroxy-acid oxidizing protein n=1 Tax=Amycolatopsis acidiphila TaxID=715473 RepID=A0A557ZQP6_9PSEU|nr:alpha-hydroxy acid oxidase [Amycolatopsis acidiphila]TVT14345.1 alpha-hydroxy-acid oxidizing protein [Amycolatopsis acidiphila]UIJ62059.1 alpha-hydroxy-acid oxidizing protein [Amycolatopsis acidiphila]GHG99492.1 alpha-hydroxy-acid oxidizing enzyme [Amycolatopsis acidiphila]